MLLEGRVILVTGASGGIGRRLAIGFAREGADVVLHYYQAEREACDVGHAVAKLGRRCELIRADLCDPAGAQALVDRTIQVFGRCDVLMNTAGGAWRTPFFDVTPDIWRRTFSTNVDSAFFCMQSVARHMVEQGKGKIINMGSIVAELATVSLVPYCAAKAALHMLTKAAAVALAPHGVTVNAIAPGVVMTEKMQKRMGDPRNRDLVLERTPTRTLVTPEDLVGVAVFLASALADHLTGQVVTVDHGYSLEGLEWEPE